MARPLDDAPDELLDAARRRVRADRMKDEEAEQGRRLARRIFIAFVLIGLVAVIFFVVLPQIGLYLPPIVPIATAATIAIGAILSFIGDHHPDANDDRDAGSGPIAFRPDDRPDDDGRPVGCCPGPGHMQCFSRDQKK